MFRIGILTSGGDCQGLNAAMRGVARTLFEARTDIEIYAYLDGYKGLMNGQFKRMQNEDFSGILTQGGTFIGTSRMPFKELHLPADPASSYEETRLEAMVRNYKMQKLDCLVMLGGNGSHKTANALREEGCNVVTLPKTIDNDLWGTEVTFGFQSAINIATEVIDGIHTTATSHGRIFIVEVMGHKVGWLTLYAGLAGGADIILIPEVPYRMEVLEKALAERREQHKRFSIIAMAEGAMSYEESQMTKKERRKFLEKQALPASYRLAKELEERCGQEVRVTVPGHFQRGGSPAPFDRVFASLCGSYAAQQILSGNFGVMVGQKKGRMACFPLEDVAGKLKYVDLDCDAIHTAMDLGLCLGEEPEMIRQYAKERPEFSLNKKVASKDQEMKGPDKKTKEKGKGKDDEKDQEKDRVKVKDKSKSKEKNRKKVEKSEA